MNSCCIYNIIEQLYFNKNKNFKEHKFPLQLLFLYMYILLLLLITKSCLYILLLLITKSCLTFATPMDCSPPGSSVHGIFQARILEWVATFFSGGIFLTQGSNLHLLHWQVGSLPLSHQGNPVCMYYQRFIWCSAKCNTFPIKNYSISKSKAHCIFKIYISRKAHLLHLHQMKKWQLCLEILQILRSPWISELSYHPKIVHHPKLWSSLADKIIGSSSWFPESPTVGREIELQLWPLNP